MTEKQTQTYSAEKPKTIDLGTPDQLTALYAGLDAAAQTAETWKAGLRAYEKSMKDGLGIDQARWDALDAAASDSDYWTSGLNTLETNLVDNEVPIGEEAAVPTFEVEESLENKPFSVQSAFRTETAEYRYSEPHYSGNQDKYMVDDIQRLYGVYAGAGGTGGGPVAAAKEAKYSLHESLRDIAPRSEAEFIELLKKAHKQAEKDILENGMGGATVATTVKILEIEGITYAGIAHAGDTRLFLRDAENVITSLTPDQSDGNVLRNYLADYDSQDSDQFSVRELHEGDRLMMCSDGITGELPREQLFESQFKYAFGKKTPTECAATFVSSSKTEDDKTIIVIDINK